MKKIFLFFLIVLPFYLVFSIYSLDRDYFLCPIKYKGRIIIRSDSRGDGSFASPRNGNRLHNGIDLLAEMEAPVYACRSGRVIAARGNNGMGNYVKLQHKGGLVTIYGHLSKIYVHSDEFIRQGWIIGSVGKTGNANHPMIQPHLHFEVRKDDIPQNPLDFLE